MKTATKIAYTAVDEVHSAIGRLGRTEDIHFSPDNRCLAVAGMLKNKILILDIDISVSANKTEISFTDYLEVTSPSFANPHGIFWIDDETIITANREGEVSILNIPTVKPASRKVEVQPAQVIDATSGKVRSPGSVSVTRIHDSLLEVLVCNNYQNNVSRHLIDESDNYRILSNETLLVDGLDIPDGVSYSRTGRWVAVSNHNDNSVFMYENDAHLNNDHKACGALRGINYPHGLRFSQDEQFLLVADAGAPFVHLFAGDQGTWYHERKPVASIQVIDDATFEAGKYNPQEGGPKGMDLSRDDRILVASCEKEPIVFYDISESLAEATRQMKDNPTDSAGQYSDEKTHMAFVRHIESAQLTLSKTQRLLETSQAGHENLVSEIRDLQSRLDRGNQNLREFEIRNKALVNSRSWRVTAPLRWIGIALRRLK